MARLVFIQVALDEFAPEVERRGVDRLDIARRMDRKCNCRKYYDRQHDDHRCQSNAGPSQLRAQDVFLAHVPLSDDAAWQEQQEMERYPTRKHDAKPEGGDDKSPTRRHRQGFIILGPFRNSRLPASY
jgi:hypothetical protein